jgi:Fic family protein
VKPAKPLPLPIKSIDWSSHIPALGRANRAIARYGAMLTRLPNPDLLLSPLTVQEAVLSSRIEGTFATMSEVLQFDAGAEPEQESKRLDIEEINRYRQALQLAEQSLQRKPFGLNLLLDMHRTLLKSARGANKMPGAFRREQNYIGSRAGGVETIRFVPPVWESLPEALSNWETYYHEDAPDPIIQLALIHAQFEFLHPFLDGNGRIGRILIPLFLYERGLLPRPMESVVCFLSHSSGSPSGRERNKGRRHFYALRKSKGPLHCSNQIAICGPIT